jgi:predicted amino acid dehydrogenase
MLDIHGLRNSMPRDSGRSNSFNQTQTIARTVFIDPPAIVKQDSIITSKEHIIEEEEPFDKALTGTYVESPPLTVKTNSINSIIKPKHIKKSSVIVKSSKPSNISNNSKEVN